MVPSNRCMCIGYHNDLLIERRTTQASSFDEAFAVLIHLFFLKEDLYIVDINLIKCYSVKIYSCEEKGLCHLKK